MTKKMLIFAVFILSACGEAPEQVYGATRNTDTINKVEVNCGDIYDPVKTLVVSVWGQSNSANHVPVKYTPRNPVYNFFDGKCYLGESPLLGATGSSGSVIARLADKILDTYPQYDNIIILSAGVAGTSIYEWTAGTVNNTYLIWENYKLQNKGMDIDLMLFHQGEADAFYGTLKYQYKYHFKNMLWNLRYYGITAPLSLAQASHCFQYSSDQVLQAQHELAEEISSIYHGPNTDLLDNSYRFDGCHFSDYGADVVADMWLDTLGWFFNPLGTP